MLDTCAQTCVRGLLGLAQLGRGLGVLLPELAHLLVELALLRLESIDQALLFADDLLDLCPVVAAKFTLEPATRTAVEDRRLLVVAVRGR